MILNLFPKLCKAVKFTKISYSSPSLACLLFKDSSPLYTIVSYYLSKAPFGFPAFLNLQESVAPQWCALYREISILNREIIGPPADRKLGIQNWDCCSPLSESSWHSRSPPPLSLPLLFSPIASSHSPPILPLSYLWSMLIIFICCQAYYPYFFMLFWLNLVSKIFVSFTMQNAVQRTY